MVYIQMLVAIRIMIKNFTILFLLFTISAEAQKIASIEKNNCATKKYSYVLRELFCYTNAEWQTIEDTNKSVSYYLPFKKSDRLITFKRKIKNTNYNSCDEGLFSIKKKYVTPINFSDVTAMSFEYEELKEYQIITNSKETIKNQENKLGSLSMAQKKLIEDELIKKLESFGLQRRNPICPINEINNEYRLTNDGLIVGTLEIQTGQCSYFALPGRAYGGGQLHFILYPNNKVKFLFANTELLEMADYNGNGRNEYLFYISNFNCYGYILFYDDFEKYEKTTWSYH